MTRRVRFTPFLCAGVFVAGGLALAGRARAVEVPFGAPPAPSTTATGARDVLAGDVDGDGDLDVLSAASGDPRVAWHENMIGNGTAWTTRTIAAGGGPWSLAVADIDRDNDLDVVSTGPTSGALAWHENTAGNGSAWTTHTIATGLAGPRAVAVADIDRDGRTDVVLVTAGSLSWYRNAAGNGSLWTPQAIAGALAGGWAVDTADVDGDGDLDVLVATRDDDTLAWHENVGGAGTSWTRRVISATADGAAGVRAADVDRDGDLDALAVSTFDGRLAWHENSSGNGSAWSAHDIATLGAPLALDAADVDGDGDVDALSASQSTDSLVWAENLGGGAAWTTRGVASGPDNPLATRAADVDGDGDLDVLAASFLDGRIGWHRNQTLHRNACFRQSIPIAAPGLEPVVALSADVDGDGGIDVAWSSNNRLAWERNAALDGSAWSTQVIAAGPEQADLRAGDLDRDGDLDLVTMGDGSAPKLRWYAQLTAGGWSPQDISGYVFATTSSVSVADIDGDGDLDALPTAAYVINAGWQENLGNASAWNTRVLSGIPPSQAALADIDGDGDLDAYVEWYDATTMRRVAWRRNTDGLGLFGAPTTIYSIYGSTRLFTADLDGDGDGDLVTRLGVRLPVSDGTAFGFASLPGVDAARVAAADFDRDGDLDLLAASVAGDANWCENRDGDALNWNVRGLPSPQRTRAVFAGDFDRDGDADVGLASRELVEWRRNEGGQAELAAVSIVPPAPGNGQLVPLLRLDARHLGRAGDSEAELGALGLLFEESAGDPLTSAEANALIESLRVYRDANGNGVFDPGSDTQVVSLDALALSGGVQTLPFADGDPNARVPFGAPAVFFLVAELTADASTQSPAQFRVTHLATGAAASRLEDRAADLPLTLACPVNVTSAVVGPITPVELLRFSVE